MGNVEGWKGKGGKGGKVLDGHLSLVNTLSTGIYFALSPLH